MKVIVLEPIHDIAMEKLRQQVDVIDWTDERKNDWSQADGIIVRAQKITKQQIDSAPILKVIGKHGIGVNAIDIQSAREKHIQVVYTPTSNVNSVAELIISLLFAVSRQLLANMTMLKKGATGITPPSLTGFELSNKVLGLVGGGRISQRVAEIMSHGLNMQIHTYDPYLSESDSQRLGMIKHDNLTELLHVADFVSVSVPLTEATQNLISARELHSMKPSAILINTSRGGVVNEHDLFDALKTGQLFGAAADVFVQEPPPASHPLLSLPNFIGTLHVGACTEEALIRVGETVVDDVLAILQGMKPQYPYLGK